MAMKKKILFVVEAMGGGIFTYIVALANKLVNSFDIYVAYAVRKQTPENYKSYFDNRIHLIKVRNFNRKIDLVQDVKAFFEIKKIAKAINPDVIHLHSSKAGILGRWAFNGHKIPLFYTPHGYSFLMIDHSFVKRTFYRIIEAVSAKRYCTTISCSKGEHMETLKLTRHAAYVNNGVDMEEIQSLIDSISIDSDHPFTVFTLGRICYQKNPKLFNQIAEALPDVKFLWIGDGELKEELTASNIEVTGWVEKKEALQYSLSADVFLLTSLWEGLPVSLLEAMYLRKLCVVNDCIGNHDVIHTGKNGFVCKDIGEFVKAIQDAKKYINKIVEFKGQKIMQECSEMNTIEILLSNAYKDILKEYNTKIMTKKYSEIYKVSINGIRNN